MSDFADRLNALFGAFLQPGGVHGRRAEEWSNSTVGRVAAENGTAGEKPVLTRQYLGMLRSGERTQPSLRAANAIALAFAELSARSGTPRSASAILNYLAGEIHDDHDPTDPEQVRQVLEEPVARGARDESTAVRARLGDGHDPESLQAVQALIERLSRTDAEPFRRRLAGLLGVRPSGAPPHGPDGGPPDPGPAGREPT